MASNSRIILALDTDELDLAGQWIQATFKSVGVYKVGLEFFLKFGHEGIKKLYEYGDFELFLDLKLHDIPNTVAGAVAAVREIEPRFLTVHASGGTQMIAAAAKGAPEIDMTAVTVLTSLNESMLNEMGIDSTPMDLAISLAKNSIDAGARAIVCSPLEVSAIRSAVGKEPTLITPGVRPSDSQAGDQSRTMTPQDAIDAGANYLVIGRPITSYFKESAEAMSTRASQILDSIS